MSYVLQRQFDKLVLLDPCKQEEYHPRVCDTTSYSLLSNVYDKYLSVQAVVLCCDHLHSINLSIGGGYV